MAPPTKNRRVTEARTHSRKLLDQHFNTKENVIKLSVGNTPEHEMAKFLICYELEKQGKQYVTEAIFQGVQRRADVFVLDDQEAIEIIQSEQQESIEQKKRDYAGIGVAVRGIGATETVRAWLVKRLEDRRQHQNSSSVARVVVAKEKKTGGSS